MKRKLLSSVIFVAVFWWLVLFFYWYASLYTFDMLKESLLSFSGFPDFDDLVEPIKISFQYWVFPVLLIGVIATIVGAILGILSVVIPKYRRAEKLNKNDSWRGIGISLGELPKPKWVVKMDNYNPEGIMDFLNKKLDEIYKDEKEKCKKENPDNFEECFEQSINFTPKHKKVLLDILYYIWKNRETAFVGAGHGVDLYEHTVSVLERSWQSSDEPLVPIVAAGHDVGKIFAYQRDENGEWEKIAQHDTMGKRFVVGLDSYWVLDWDEKEVLNITIGFGHKEDEAPYLPIEIERRVEHIWSIVNKADRAVTAKEKADALSKHVTPELIKNAFLEALKEVKFHTPQAKHQVNYIGFKKKNEVFLLEPGFRDVFLSKLPEDVAAAFGNGFRRKGNISAPTMALLFHLKQLGWLIDEGNGMFSECGLWSIRIGMKVFNGALGVRLPKQVLKELPVDTDYNWRLETPLLSEYTEDQAPADAIPHSQLSPEEKKEKQIAALISAPIGKVKSQNANTPLLSRKPIREVKKQDNKAQKTKQKEAQVVAQNPQKSEQNKVQKVDGNLQKNEQKLVQKRKENNIKNKVEANKKVAKKEMALTEEEVQLITKKVRGIVASQAGKNFDEEFRKVKALYLKAKMQKMNSSK